MFEHSWENLPKQMGFHSFWIVSMRVELKFLVFGKQLLKTISEPALPSCRVSKSQSFQFPILVQVYVFFPRDFGEMSAEDAIWKNPTMLNSYSKMINYNQFYRESTCFEGFSCGKTLRNFSFRLRSPSRPKWSPLKRHWSLLLDLWIIMIM